MVLVTQSPAKYEIIGKEEFIEDGPIRTRIPVHYFKQEQRLEFHCPFCNQAQGWISGVRVEESGEVQPDPKTAFSRHLLGDSSGKNRCFAEPTVDEVDEYDPIVRIKA
jgi:hypothetical protein